MVPASSHHLSTIVKITSKKRQPEIITFKYGTSNRDEVTVFDMDRWGLGPWGGGGGVGIALSFLPVPVHHS